MNNLKQLVPESMLLAMCFGIQSYASADVLYPDPSKNTQLPDGEYVFAGAHPANTVFLDELQFSLDHVGNISATVDNISIPLPPAAGAVPDLFGNQLLMLSLFDNNGTFISASGAGGTLSATGLNSGVTYTLAVSGKASGIFGGVYQGELNVDAPPAVPLPPALPGFAAALATLGLRRKKSEAGKK